MRPHTAIVLAIATLVVSANAQRQTPAPHDPDAGFRFKSGVDLINVTAVVSDAAGRFVPGLLKDDFLVYEDDQPQMVTLFNAERVAVSRGKGVCRVRWNLHRRIAGVAMGAVVHVAPL